MSKSIVINCFGGTGSSLLAQSFEKGGMWLGNKKTYYKGIFPYEEAGPHAEHGVITALHGHDFNEIPGSTVIEKLTHILTAFKNVAEDKGHDFYGFKSTGHFFSGGMEGMIKALDDADFGDIRVFTMRHPMGVAKRNGRKAEDFNPEMTMDHYRKYLDNGWLGVPFPELWEKDKVRDLLEYIGLEWNADIPPYKPHSASERGTGMNIPCRGILTDSEKEAFSKDHPKWHKRWVDISEEAMLQYTK